MATPKSDAAPSISLAEYTSPALVVPQLAAEDAAAALRELSFVLHADGRVSEPTRFCQEVIDRESRCSTALDFGVAFPHARTALAAGLCFAVGRSRRALSWGAGGVACVQLVFLIAAPIAEPVAYLKLVAALARWCDDPVALTRLKTAASAGDMFSVLTGRRSRSNSGDAF